VTKIFHLQQSNIEREGKFSFTNRLNYSWLDESEKQMKKTLNPNFWKLLQANVIVELSVMLTYLIVE
jgi:hypothetical protein